MKNYLQHGDRITVIAAAAIASGAGVLSGDTFGVATHAVANGAPLELQLVGVFTLPAVGANTGAAGAKVYWDSAAGNITTTVASNKLVGVLAAAKANGEATAVVRLNGVSV